MLSRIRYFLADLAYALRPRMPGRRGLLGLGAVLGVAALAAGGYFVYTELEEDEEAPPAPAPEIFVREVEAEEPADLGFPAFATRNTTRVAGADPVADAAGVALAAFPSTGGLEGPAAVSVVDVADWPSAVAAASLVAEPVRAPILFSDGDDVPESTTSALRSLAPAGSAATDDRQLFRIGAATAPEGPRTLDVDGESPAEVAAEIERLRRRLTGSDPEHVLLASADEPAFAMPAAAWAARSGDPVLFLERRSAPEATLEALRAYKGVPAYVLGPASAVSERAVNEVRKVVSSVKRVSGPDPVENAIAFARYVDGTFGWNINDPGHGFVLASTDRPADAGAAAPLSAGGTWGPLLLTDDAGALPSALRGYLLDLKPGYQDDPTRAVYNHVWVIGDEAAIDVGVQAQVDELAELARIRSGAGGSVLGPPPGTPEQEAPDRGSR